jgi:hypothetical protein
MKRDPKETGGIPGCRTYLGDSQLYIHGIGHVLRGSAWSPTTLLYTYLKGLVIYYLLILKNRKT